MLLEPPAPSRSISFALEPSFDLPSPSASLPPSHHEQSDDDHDAWTDCDSEDSTTPASSTEPPVTEPESPPREPVRPAPAPAHLPTFTVECQEHRRRSKRPLLLSPSPWPRASSAQGPGPNELPAAFVHPEEVDRAHGVLGGRKHESGKVARQQPIPLLNKPATRPRRSPIPQQTLLDGQRPRPGHFDDLFRRDGKSHFKFHPRQHGDWVRTRLRQQSTAAGGRRQKYWSLTPEQRATEIEAWFVSNQQDLVQGKAWAAAGCKGTFKPQAKIWIIPQLALASWARGRIWDTAAFFTAPPADRASIQIDLQKFKTTGKAVWNATTFKQWGAASQLPDLQGLQEITDAACWLPFQGTMCWKMVGYCSHKLDPYWWVII